MPKIDRQAIYERDGGLCGFCGQHVPLELLHLDHYPVPRSLDGPTEPDNLRVAHQRCNIVAGKAVVVERRRLGLKPIRRRVIRRAVDPAGLLPSVAKRMLTIGDIVDRAKVNPETVRRWIRGGQLKAVLIGGRKTGFRVAESEVDCFLRERQYRPD